MTNMIERVQGVEELLLSLDKVRTVSLIIGLQDDKALLLKMLGQLLLVNEQLVDLIPADKINHIDILVSIDELKKAIETVKT